MKDDVAISFARLADVGDCHASRFVKGVSKLIGMARNDNGAEIVCRKYSVDT